MVNQDIKLSMFLPIKPRKLKPEHYHARQTVIPTQCFRTNKSYEESYQPLTMFLSIKTGSELTQFTPKKKLDIHRHKGLCFTKSRLADVQDIEEMDTKKGTLAQLLITKGIVKHSLVIPEFSSISWSLVWFHHQTNLIQV